MDRVLKIVYDKWVKDIPLPNGIHPLIANKIIEELANTSLTRNEALSVARQLADQAGCPYRDHDNFYRHFENNFDRSQIIDVSQIQDDDAIYLFPMEYKRSINTLFANYQIGNTYYTFLDTIDSTLLKHIQSGKVKIVVNHIHDPLSDYIKFKEFEDYLERYNVDPTNTIVVNGCGSVNPGKIKTSIGYLFLQESAEKMASFPTKGDLGYISDNVKPEDLNPAVSRHKKFLCFNRNYKEHRVVLLYLMLKNDMLKDSTFSFIHKLSPRDIVSSLDKFYPQFKDDPDYEKLSSIMVDTTPYEIDTQNLPTDSKKSFATNTNKKEIYLDSYFHILPETDFRAGGTFLSEKTFRPIQNLQPFLLIGQPNSLKILKDFGFKTFHPYINESYDAEMDDRARMLLIEAEIKKLANMSLNDLHTLYYSLTDILIHNQNHLKTFLRYNPYSVFVDSLDTFYPKGT